MARHAICSAVHFVVGEQGGEGKTPISRAVRTPFEQAVHTQGA